MTKRIALFILGVVLAVGAFLLYQHFSGANVGNGYKLKPVATAPTKSQGMSIESRDETGKLEYLITAPASPVQLKDEAGNPLPGQFVVLSPVATFFDKSGRTIEVRADKCELLVAQGAKSLTGGLPILGGRAVGSKSSSAKVQLEQLSGNMTGHVRLVLSPRPVDTDTTKPATSGSKDPFADGLRMYFDGPVKLEGNNERLTADGPFHIRSNSVEGDFEGMTLVFNKASKQIESLRIEENPNGNKLFVRNMGPRAFSIMDGGKTTTAPAAGGGASSIAGVAPPSEGLVNVRPGMVVGPAAPVKAEPTTYRLGFGQNVVALAGKNVLSFDRLFLIFMASQGAGDTNPGAATGPGTQKAPPGLTSGVVAQMNIPEEAEPIAAAKEQDLVVTWEGPLEMRPLDDATIKLANANDVMMDGVGTAAKPVTIKDPRFEAEMGELRYRPGQPISLLAGDFGKVRMKDLSGNKDLSANKAPRAEVESGDVTIDQQKNRVQIAGPGQVISSNDAGDKTFVKFDRMALELQSLLDPKDPDKKKTVMGIRRAVIDGAIVNSDTFDLTSGTLDVLIANVVKNGNVTQWLEHLLATDHVDVRSYSKKTATMARAETGGLQGQRMEILTKVFQGPEPAPSTLIAEGGGGDVKAWRIVDKSKSAVPATMASVAATMTAAVAGKDLVAAAATKGVETDTILTPRFVADLMPVAKSTTLPAGVMPTTATAVATKVDAGFAGMGQSVIVRHFVADDARVEIKTSGSETRLVTASANLLDAYPDRNTAMLTAIAKADGAITPVRVAMNGNFIESRAVDLKFDPGEQTFKVPGPGTFKFSLPPDGKTRKEPMPLVVTWQESMLFDNVKRQAVFTGFPVAQVLGDQADLAMLSCSKTLTVQLKSGTAAGGAGATGAAVTDPLAMGNMQLDWIEAVGNVQSHGAQLGPNKTKLTEMLISAIDTPSQIGKPGQLGVLRYSDGVFEVPGPGSLVVENFRPDKADARVSSEGTSLFNWLGSLKYDEGANTITFARGVDFFFKPVKPFRFIDAGAAGATTKNSGAAATAQKIEPAHLHTDLLTAILSKPKAETNAKTVQSPIGLGAGGNQDVSRVLAQNGAKLEIADYKLGGDSLVFDVPTNTATVTGKGEDRVWVTKSDQGRAEGTSIILDMTKDNNFVKVENMRGDFMAGMPVK